MNPIEDEFQGWLKAAFPTPLGPEDEQYFQLRAAFYSGSLITIDLDRDLVLSIHMAFLLEVRARYSAQQQQEVNPLSDPTMPAAEANPDTKEAADIRQSAAGPEALGLADTPPGRREHLLTFLDFHEGLRALATLHQRNTNLVLQEIFRMSTAAVTRAQMDQGFQSLIAAEAQRDAAVIAAFGASTQAFTDLKAKIANGQVVTPEDFSYELAQVEQLYTNALGMTQSAAGITQQATADDPGPTVVTPAPVNTATPPTSASPASTTTEANVGAGDGSAQASASSSAEPAAAAEPATGAEPAVAAEASTTAS